MIVEVCVKGSSVKEFFGFAQRLAGVGEVEDVRRGAVRGGGLMGVKKRKIAGGRNIQGKSSS